jgi:hypothetical protein
MYNLTMKRVWIVTIFDSNGYAILLLFTVRTHIMKYYYYYQGMLYVF